MRDVIQPWHGVQPSVVLAVVAEVGDAFAMRHHGAVAAVDQHLRQAKWQNEKQKVNVIVTSYS